MKVNLRKNYRRELTLEQFDMAKQIIAQMKDDEFKPEQYAKVALDHYFAKCETVRYYLEEVVTASAWVEQNHDGYYQYSTETADMDVKIKALAKVTMGENDRLVDGFVEIECYLSTIWSIGDSEDFRRKMYLKRYVEY